MVFKQRLLIKQSWFLSEIIEKTSFYDNNAFKEVTYLFFMRLEKTLTDNKPGFFKRIAKKVRPYAEKIMPYIFAAGLGLSIMNCEDPGPISVQNTVTPIVVPSSGNVYWKVNVTNLGGEVTIEQARFRERAISGWAVGLYDISGDLPITSNEISAHSTATIFSFSGPVYNTGPNDITFENTVTVTSDGGDDSDTCTYIVTFSGKSLDSKSLGGKQLSEEKQGTAQGLADYLR